MISFLNIKIFLQTMQVDRLLGIGMEKLVLLDSKSLLLTKSQPTSDLEIWRTGGGKSRDQVILEFRATKWSFIAASPGSLRSIGTELWEVMQDLDVHFLQDHVITTRQDIDNGKLVVLFLKKKTTM